MILWAEIDANGWAVIIGAVFLGLTQIVHIVLDWLRGREAARKVDEVKAQTEVTARHAEIILDKVDAVQDSVRMVAGGDKLKVSGGEHG